GKGDDTIGGGQGNDTIIHNVGDGHDRVMGGGEAGVTSPHYDTIVVHGDATQRTFNLENAVGGAEIPGLPNNATDIAITYTGPDAGSIRADEVERVVFNLGSAGDTVVIGTLTNTALAP